MAKKDERFVALSGVDHKLRFISVMAVIVDITPTIYRSKLTKITLNLLDETVKHPGFTVKVNMESEMLDHFLNAAKRGFIIQLNEIKVIKNEGEVYGEVLDEEEITLYDESQLVQKWYPAEKRVIVTGVIKNKLQTLLTWKKTNLRITDEIKENEEVNTKKRRSATVSSDKANDSSTSARNIRAKDSSSSKEKKHEEINSNTMKIKQNPSASNLVKHDKAKKSSISSNEADVPSTKLSKTTLSLSTSRLTRAKDASSFKKSSSLSSLKTERKISLSHSEATKNVVNERKKVNISKTKMVLSESKSQVGKNNLKRNTLKNVNESDEECSSPLRKKTCLMDLSDSSDTASEAPRNKRHSFIKNPTLNSSDSTLSESSNSATSTRNSKQPVRQNVSVVKRGINKTDSSSDSPLSDISNPVTRTRKPKQPVHQNVSVVKRGINKTDSSSDSPLSDISNPVTRTRNPKQPVHQNVSVVKRGINKTDSSSDSPLSDISNPVTRTRNPKQPVDQNVSATEQDVNKTNSSCNSPLSDISNPVTRTRNSKQPVCQNVSVVKQDVNKTNSSIDSPLSDNSNPAKNARNSKQSVIQNVSVIKRVVSKTDISDVPPPKKKLKQDLQTDARMEDGSIPNQNILNNQGNKNESKKSSKQGGAVSQVKPNSNDQAQTTTLYKTRKQIVYSQEVYEEASKLPTKNIFNSDNKTAKSNKESGKYDIYDKYLQAFSKKSDFTSVVYNADISLYDLEELVVPDKFDIRCKVVSEFVMFDDAIQVVRVEDGTLCKCDTLKIPLCNSWDEVSKEITENPIVEQKSPYIDIIIFNYFRLDFPIKSGKFYEIHNIMAVKFLLKNDPRKVKNSKSEIFFCVEGQNANIKKLYQKQIKELEERISSRTGNTILQVITKKNVIPEKPHLNSFDDGGKRTDVDGKNSATPNKKLSLEPRHKTTERDSRLQTHLEGQCNVEFGSDNFTRIPPSTEKITKSGSLGKSTDKGGANSDKNPAITTNSSDETILEENLSLTREIKETLNEESASGLPLTNTEDVHLKNSGSEVTFSQFCEAVKLKGGNFRTSTQDFDDVNQNTSPTSNQLDELPGDRNLVTGKEVILTEETNKMDPLVYCPSGSSASSVVCSSPEKNLFPQDGKIMQSCSVSMFKNNQLKTISDLKPSDPESSSSLKILSSNDSEVTSCSNVNIVEKMSPAQMTELDHKSENESQSKDTDKSALQKVNNDSSLSSKLTPLAKTRDPANVLECVRSSDNKTSANETIEVASDSSCSVSLFTSVSNVTEKPMATVTEKEKIPEDNLQKRLKTIPDRCFYRSANTRPTLTEHELNEIYDEDDNGPCKFFSYCQDRHLKPVSLDTILRVKNTNSLTIIVTFVDICPSQSNKWEDCIKARCPSCSKLYDVYNAANKRDQSPSTPAAISVGSHIVCPESQCCNQILESPEFNISLDLMLKDSTKIKALLGGKHAESVFGCSAAVALRNEGAFSHVSDVLDGITKRIEEGRPAKVVVTRENILDPDSSPLYLTQVDV